MQTIDMILVIRFWSQRINSDHLRGSFNYDHYQKVLKAKLSHLQNKQNVH